MKEKKKIWHAAGKIEAPTFCDQDLVQPNKYVFYKEREKRKMDALIPGGSRVDPGHSPYPAATVKSALVWTQSWQHSQVSAESKKRRTLTRVKITNQLSLENSDFSYCLILKHFSCVS